MKKMNGKSKRKGMSVIALLGLTLMLTACTSSQGTGSTRMTGTEEGTEKSETAGAMGYEDEIGSTGELQEPENTAEDKEEPVDLSGMNPDAVREIQNTLKSINETISVDEQTEPATIIRQSVGVMGLATGNSLVEEQVKLVIKDWKQQLGSEEAEAFKTRFAIVYEEYGKLAGEEAQTELEKADLSLEEYDYCGNGRLDMVEWIYTYLQ